MAVDIHGFEGCTMKKSDESYIEASEIKRVKTGSVSMIDSMKINE